MVIKLFCDTHPFLVTLKRKEEFSDPKSKKLHSDKNKKKNYKSDSDSSWGKINQSESESEPQRANEENELARRQAIYDYRQPPQDTDSDRGDDQAHSDFDQRYVAEYCALLDEIKDMVLPNTSKERMTLQLDKNKLIGYYSNPEDSRSFVGGILQKFFDFIIPSTLINDPTKSFRNLDLLFGVEVGNAITMTELQSKITSGFTVPWLNILIKLVQAKLVHFNQDTNDVLKLFDLLTEKASLLVQSYMKYKTLLCLQNGKFVTSYIFGSMIFRSQSVIASIIQDKGSAIVWDILMFLAENGCKKYPNHAQPHLSQVCVPKYVNGTFTYYYEEWNHKTPDLQSYIASIYAVQKSVFNGFGAANISHILSHKNSIPSIARTAGILNVPFFPILETRRNFYSARNGILDTHTLKFYTYKELNVKIPDGIKVSELVSHNYIDVEFPENKLKVFTIENWREIEVPPLAKIFRDQRFHEKDGLVDWIYALFFGRNFYWSKEIEEESWTTMFGASGAPGSGKSVCLEALKLGFHPRNIAYLSNSSQKTFVVKTFEGKMIILALDVGSGLINDKFSGIDITDLFRIISNEDGPSNSKHVQEPTNFSFKGTFVWASNSLLSLNSKVGSHSDLTDALARRSIVLRFLWGVTNVDTTLLRQLREEYIWHFILKSCYAYHEFAGLYGKTSIHSVIPEYLRQGTDEIRKQSNSLHAFMKDATDKYLICPPGEHLRGKPSDKYYCSEDKFIDLFKDWCKKQFPDQKIEWKPSLYHAVFQNKNLTITSDVAKPDPDTGTTSRKKWILGLKIKNDEDKMYENLIDIISSSFKSTLEDDLDEISYLELKDFQKVIDTKLKENYQINDDNYRNSVVNSVAILQSCLSELGYQNNLGGTVGKAQKLFQKFQNKLVILFIQIKK